MTKVAVLFTRQNSAYNHLAGVEVYDAQRDALTFPGGMPIVAHPPCRAWSRLRTFSKHPPAELELALWAVAQVRQCGGVLEHPESSQLWPTAKLPRPGQTDSHSGWTLPVHQLWWKHKAEKRTWLYIVGCEPSSIPPIPFTLDYARGTVAGSLSHAQREATPPAFAEWLVELARRCRP